MDLFANLFGRNREMRAALEQSRSRLYRMAFAWCHSAALADDLENYLHGTPLRGTPSRRVDGLGRIARRNAATLGGHVWVEDYATISAFSGVHQFCRVGEHAFIGGYSVVTKDAMP